MLTLPDTLFNEVVFGVKGAKILWADDQLLKSLFRHLGLRKFKTTVERDSWLLKKFGFLSQPHFLHNEVHAVPERLADTTSAHRPIHYGRAFVLRVGDQFFDVKGAGLQQGHTPKLERYRTGLVSLNRAIGELFTCLLFQRIQKQGQSVAPLPFITLIKLPFEFSTGIKGITTPAALLVRPHITRHHYGTDILPSTSRDVDFLFHTELILRRHGITSCLDERILKICRENDKICGIHKGKNLSKASVAVFEEFCKTHELSFPASFDPMNIQFGIDNTGRRRLVDFNQYNYRSKFENHILQIESDDVESRGVLDVLPTTSEEFVDKDVTSWPAAQFLTYLNNGSVDNLPFSFPIAGRFVDLLALHLVCQSNNNHALRKIVTKFVSIAKGHDVLPNLSAIIS